MAHLNLLRSQLRNGVVVAAPTETAYGLLANALNKQAVVAVVRIKGREHNKPMALVANDLKMVSHYFKISPNELRLAKKFWPGPLTLLLKPRQKFSVGIVGVNGRVGVRVPASAWLRKLVTLMGTPLTATSANRAGGPTSFSSNSVIRQLRARGLSHLVDGGRLKRVSVSTVAYLNNKRLIILRDGAISRARLERVLRSIL